jgi:hypothetical protein
MGVGACLCGVGSVVVGGCVKLAGGKVREGKGIGGGKWCLGGAGLEKCGLGLVVV